VALKNALDESDKKVLTGLEGMKKAFNESDREVLSGIEEMKETINKSDREVLSGLERVENALEKSNKGNFVVIISAAILFLICFLLALLRKRLFEKAESVENQYWPKEMNLIADMYLRKKNGDQSRGCPFCNVEVRGKNYVAHLRKCKTSPLYDKTVEEAKEILKENQ
jgi:hypothetical protein